MSFRYLLVDDFGSHLRVFEAEVPDWSLGMEFFAAVSDLRSPGFVPTLILAASSQRPGRLSAPERIARR
jgi:hypothetical protein